MRISDWSSDVCSSDLSRDQTRLLRAQHAVAEHVAAHVADADRSEWLNLNIRAQFTKVALHALPGAARGDAHFLVVVAGAATGRKCITKPETIFVGNPIGDVGKRGRAFIGRDHQIRIIVVETHDISRRHDVIADAVVGDIEQTAQRSEEHTSELQSLMRISYAVFCLKKKNQQQETT